MRNATIPLITAVVLGIGTSATAQDGGTISDFCRDVLSVFEEQIDANGLVVTESVEGGTVRMMRGDYLDFLKLQLDGRAKQCLKFVVEDDSVQSTHEPA